MRPNRATLIRLLRYWLPAAIASTLLAGLVYAAVQNVLRISGNDPQIQMAEDAAAALEAGARPDAILSPTKVDIGRSLAPFLMIFDDSGRPAGSSAQLHQQTPQLPSGVFADARAQGQLRFTWQPEPGVRSAVVITHFGGASPGFVVAGRSLREIEKREETLVQLVGLAWGVTLALTFAATLLLVVLD